MTNRKRLFLFLLLLIQLGLIWPIYPLFSGIQPMILGLPVSFAWIIGLLLASFFLLLWYHLSEPSDEPDRTTTNSVEDR